MHCFLWSLGSFLIPPLEGVKVKNFKIIGSEFVISKAKQQWVKNIYILKKILTNFSGHGKSNSFTIPKSSPVTTLRPEWDTQAQVTSALSVLRDQIPTTSSPRTLDTGRERKIHLHYICGSAVPAWCIYVLTFWLSPCPGGPGNPINLGLLCDLPSGRHLVHQSFISTCGYLFKCIWG